MYTSYAELLDGALSDNAYDFGEDTCRPLGAKEVQAADKQARRQTSQAKHDGVLA